MENTRCVDGPDLLDDEIATGPEGDPPAKPAATVIAIVTSSDSVEAKMCSLRYLQFERLFPSRVPE
jgi:hypothetical protein